MPLKLKIHYKGLNDLASNLVEHADRGAMLLPLADVPETVHQYDPVEMIVDVEGQQSKMVGEVVQVLPGTGLVVSITDPGRSEELVAYATFSEAAFPPEVEILEATAEPPPDSNGAPDGAGSSDGGEADPPGEDDWAEPDADGGPPDPGGPSAAGSSPTLWSQEKLRAEWDNLSVAQQIRVARYGRRDARNMIMKGIDRKLHSHVLSNPKVTADEVAVMASMAGLDPDTLRRIAASPEWTRHTPVVRSLVCNPKLGLTQVEALLNKLSQDELRRLSRTGKVRGAVKQAIIKKLEGGKGGY